MNTTRRFSTFLLAAVALVGVQPSIHAQTVSPVPAPTIITSAPYTITQSGYYQLGANINYNGTGAANEAIITINAPNVTLDLAGHYIAGPTDNPATTLFGVYASDRANVLIQNGTISYCYIGVEMVGTDNPSFNLAAKHRNPRVLNMTVTKCYYVGVDLENAILPEVANCRVSSIGGSTVKPDLAIGIDLGNSQGGSVAHCAVSVVIPVNYTASGLGYGILSTFYAVDNQVTSCAIGLSQCIKYKDTLTYNCGTPYQGGLAVGDNN